MNPKVWIRATVAALLVVAPMILWTTGAEATPGLSPLPRFNATFANPGASQGPTVPGQVAPAQYVVTNSSNAGEVVTVTNVTLVPSCGDTLISQGCATPDLNVYQLNGPFTVTASPGAVCPPSYTASVLNAVTGEVAFTPVGSPPVLDVGESCQISFTTTTLRVPTIDADTTTPGAQTNQVGFASGTSPGGPASGLGKPPSTVNRAAASIATTATPQQVNAGVAFSDLATVTGVAAGPTPTGSVTFALFGPTSPGFPTCTGPAFATSAPIQLSPTGPTTATAGSGTFGIAPPAPPGNYVFVATYSGDANFAGVTSACSDPTERVTVQPPPSITVDKTATPPSRPEPGGSFTFNVVVTNTSIEPLTITALTDNIYGNIATQGTCTTAVGTVLPASGGTYTCSFTGNFNGFVLPNAAPPSQTDIVTATAVDSGGATATDTDDATVTLTPTPPVIVVDKTASPLSLPEPGGPFTFNVTVTNSSIRPVMITTLTDDIYGNIALQGSCVTALGTVLAAAPGPGNTYSCSFTGTFFANAGVSQTDVVTASAIDTLGQPASDTDDAVVTITNLPPTIQVVKTATPASLPAPGGQFTFNVVVTNTSDENVTITALTDDIYGNIATQGTCTNAIGTVLAPDATYSCSFTGNFAGASGSQTDVVTVTVIDNDGTTATDNDDAMVTITPNGMVIGSTTNNVPPATAPTTTTPTTTTPTTTTTASTLPRTGAGVSQLVTLGLGLLVTGGMFLLAASRWAPPAPLAPSGGATALLSPRRGT